MSQLLLHSIRSIFEQGEQQAFHSVNLRAAGVQLNMSQVSVQDHVN